MLKSFKEWKGLVLGAKPFFISRVCLFIIAYQPLYGQPIRLKRFERWIELF